MNFPRANFLHGQWRQISPSEGLGNSVNITIETKSVEVHENLTTGHRILTGWSTPVYPTIVTNINLRSAMPSDILLQLLRDQHISRLRLRLRFRLYLDLASKISAAATELGFGRSGFVMDIFYNVTYQNVVYMFDPPRDESLSLKAFLMRLVLLGSVKYRDESKSSNMETEPCSICLDNLVSRGSNSKRAIPTRMTCSHVFHDSCLLEWLQRKNTCPLCRSVIYDRL